MVVWTSASQVGLLGLDLFELHSQPHVACDLQFALEECLEGGINMYVWSPDDRPPQQVDMVNSLVIHT